MSSLSHYVLYVLTARPAHAAHSYRAKMYRRIGRTIAFLDRASEDARLAAIERRGKKGANLFRLDLSTFD